MPSKPRICIDLSSVALGIAVPACRAGIYRYTDQISRRMSADSRIDASFCCLGESESWPGFRDFSRRDSDYQNRLLGDGLLNSLAERIYQVQKMVDATHFYKLSKYSSGIVARARGSTIFHQRMLAGVDVLHTPFHPIPDEVNATPRLWTVHDVIPLIYPEYSAPETVQMMNCIVRRIRRRDWVVCDSENTRQDLLRLAPKLDPAQVTVNLLGVATPFLDSASPNRSSFVPDLPPGADYILSVGTVEPRKNLPTLLQAFSILCQSRDDLHLALVGATGWGAPLDLSSLDHCADRVHVLGRVDDETLATLYRNAKLFAYLSNYEGFGLPPLEAMACGTPVVVSGTSSLPEVVGDAGLYVNPTSIPEVVAALERLLDNDELRLALADKAARRATAFTWDAHFERLVELYYHIVDQINGTTHERAQ